MKDALIKRKGFACAAAVFCTLLWGTAFPFIKLGYREFSIDAGDTGGALLFAGLRFMLAGALTLVFFSIKQRRLAVPCKSELAPVLLLGAVQTFGQYMFTYTGLSLTTSANTSIITACASFFTVLAAPLFFKADRLTALKIGGCVIGFLGVPVMTRGVGFSSQTLLGDALILGSTVFAAAGNLIAKKAAQGRDPVKITAWQLLTGGAGLTAAGLALGGRLELFNLRGALILFWLATVSAAAFSVWTALLKHHPAGRISVFNLLVPVFGTALSGILAGEDVFRPELLIALGMIVVGIILVNITGKGEKNDKGRNI